MATRKSTKRPVEYNSWRAMCERCHNPKYHAYHRYGGRGITVHKEWVGPGGYIKFFEHIGPKPTAKHSVDRFPITDGNYEPGNVRWATKQEQSANRNGFCIKVTFLGKTQTLAEWGRELGIAYETLRSRHQKGLPVEKLLKVGHSRSNPLKEKS